MWWRCWCVEVFGDCDDVEVEDVVEICCYVDFVVVVECIVIVGVYVLLYECGVIEDEV